MEMRSSLESYSGKYNYKMRDAILRLHLAVFRINREIVPDLTIIEQTLQDEIGNMDRDRPFKYESRPPAAEGGVSPLKPPCGSP